MSDLTPVPPPPAGYDLILEAVAHPRDPDTVLHRLPLYRHRRTGAYVLWDGSSARRVPTRWARQASGRWLRAMREAAGLSQVRYGEALGLAGNTIARIERGELPLMPGTRADALAHAARQASAPAKAGA